MVNACEAIAQFAAGKDFADYEKNRLLRSAVERQFEIIDEALNKAEILDSSIAAGIPDLHRVIGLRNRLIHGYDNVDDEILGRGADEPHGVAAAGRCRSSRS